MQKQQIINNKKKSHDTIFNLLQFRKKKKKYGIDGRYRMIMNVIGKNKKNKYPQYDVVENRKKNNKKVTNIYSIKKMNTNKKYQKNNLKKYKISKCGKK